jgi:PAS domain S-box-containing protein
MSLARVTAMATPDTNEVSELRDRLHDVEETLRAIRSGEVDALVVHGPEGDRVFTLQGADRTYRVLIEGMQQGAVSLSVDGTVLYCNQCFADMLRWPHQRVVGASVSSFLTAPDRLAFAKMLEEGKRGSSQGELQFEIATGQLLPVYVVLAPLPLHDAAALCMVVTDLTEPKKHRDLQEADRRKDEFLAMLAHELRNPLAPIQNAVAILQHYGPLDENVKYATEIIGRQIHHLARLVDDLLDVSRITLGKVTLERQPVELATIIAAAVETSRPAIDARKHQLTLSLPPKGVRVEADPTRLAQVIGNLLANASKYTEEGGQIFLATKRSGDSIEIRVRDTGVGISEELLPRVFDLFIQGDRSLARSEGGLGIGLTLVRRLVELHDGAVTAHSAGPGTGSEFIIRLPLIGDAEPAEETAPSRQTAGGGASLKILIVEDNKDGAQTLAKLLSFMGHHVRIAYNGQEALDIVDSVQPDVIFLDIGLPGMNGFEVARRMRRHANLQDAMLIAMTGYGQAQDVDRSREAGFDHHLVKPVAPEVLRKLLDSVLSHGPSAVRATVPG